MEFGKWTQSIKTDFRNNKEIISIEKFKSFYGATHQKPQLSGADLNSTLSDIYETNGKDFHELRGFSPEEAGKRYELSMKVHEKYVDRAAKDLMNPVPSTKTSLRYPEEFMMRHEPGPEAEAYNKMVVECFTDPENHKEQLLDLHINVLKNIDKYEKFSKFSHTDEDLADNADLIIDGSRRCLQIENYVGYIKTLKLDTPEEKAKLEKFNSLVDRYHTIGTTMTTYTCRLSNIQNPLYAVIDPNDTASKEVFRDVADVNTGIMPQLLSSEVNIDCDEISNPDGLLVPYMIEGDVIRRNEIRDELGAMTKLLSYNDAKCNIKIDGVEEEFDDIEKAIDNIVFHPGAKVTVTNSVTNEALEINDFSKAYYIGKLVSSEDMTYTQEELPEKVEPPKTPEPKKPGFWANMLHTVSFGLLFKKTFNDYKTQKEQHDKEHREYDAYDKENKRVRMISMLQKKHLDKVHPNYNSDELPGLINSDSKYAMEMEKSNLERGAESIMDIYGPIRERKAHLINRNVYDHEVFRKMKSNDVDMSELKPNGLDVDDMTFAEMSMVTVLAGEFDCKRNKNLPETIGFEDIAMSSNNYRPRANIHEYIIDVAEPARKNVADCLKYFDQNVPGIDPPKTGRERLIETYGEALKVAAVNAASYKMESLTNAIDIDAIAHTMDFAEKLGIMNDIKKRGLTDDMIEKINVARKCSEITKDGYDAERKLMQENRGDLTLTTEEKRELIDKVALSRTLATEATAEDSRLSKIKEEKLASLMDTSEIPGESDEERRVRLMANTEKYVEMIRQGASGNDVQTPVLKDLLNGGNKLKELSEKYMSREERDELANKSTYDIYQSTTLKEFTRRSNITPYDGFVEKAFETVNSPAASEEELQHAAAVIVSANTLISAGKVSKEDAKGFENSVKTLTGNPEFIKKLGSADNIRNNFADRKDADKAVKKISLEVATSQPAKSGQQTKEQTKTKENIL